MTIYEKVYEKLVNGSNASLYWRLYSYVIIYAIISLVLCKGEISVSEEATLVEIMGHSVNSVLLNAIIQCSIIYLAFLYFLTNLFKEYILMGYAYCKMYDIEKVKKKKETLKTGEIDALINFEDKIYSCLTFKEYAKNTDIGFKFLWLLFLILISIKHMGDINDVYEIQVLSDVTLGANLMTVLNIHAVITFIVMVIAFGVYRYARYCKKG